MPLIRPRGEVEWGGARGGDEEEVLWLRSYCMPVCVCVYAGCARGVALEHVFYLASHGYNSDGRVGAAVAHGNRISLSLDVMWRHRGGG